MPKREKTPPPAEEHKYLIIHYPYPLHADMNEEKDVHSAALWIACIIGHKDLYAIYHKPKSPNLIIIEVGRDCPNIEDGTRMLGAHKWSEILRNPTSQERETESRCYYCTFKNGREVQKNGWRRIDVQEGWFKDFSPRNNYIKYPYPMSHYCDIPPISQSDYNLCRHLPSDKFPRPRMIVKAPTVGSEDWVDKKLTGAPVGPIIKAVASEPFANVGKAKSSAWKSVTSTKAASSVPPSVARTNVWSDMKVPHAVNSRPINARITAPPGLTRPEHIYQNSSGDENQSVVTASEASSSSNSNDDRLPTIPSSDSKLFDFEGIPIASLVIANPIEGDLIIESLWDTPEDNKSKETEPICEAHGRVCKKGICKAYCQQLRRIEIAKRDEKKGDGQLEERDRRMNQGKGRGKGRGKGEFHNRGSNTRDAAPRSKSTSTEKVIVAGNGWSTIVPRKKEQEDQNAWDCESVASLQSKPASVWGVGNNEDWSTGGGW